MLTAFYLGVGDCVLLVAALLMAWELEFHESKFARFVFDAAILTGVTAILAMPGIAFVLAAEIYSHYGG